MTTHSSPFWDPTFDYETRDDGAIIMSQPGDLPDHAPVLADYLDHWASAAPDRTWIARRDPSDPVGGDWVRISYSAAQTAARTLGAALLELGLGPDKPLLILSENSLEHAVLSMAAMYVGIPYAPIATAYSLVSQDHGKLKDIAALLNPGAIFADDGAAYAPALAAIAAPGRHVINARNIAKDAIDLASLHSTEPAPALAARGTLTAQTVAKYLFTSGSTGSPKAVINTNGMICAMQAMVRDCYRFLSEKPPWCWTGRHGTTQRRATKSPTSCSPMAAHITSTMVAPCPANSTRPCAICATSLAHGCSMSPWATT
jgi:feruloyl-CoA synthase